MKRHLGQLLAVIAVAALAVLALELLEPGVVPGDGGGRGGLRGGAAGTDPEGRAPPSLRGPDGSGRLPEGAAPPLRGPGVGLEGLRVPRGIDLSDPAQARAHLRMLLTTRPIEWADVARVIGLVEGPLGDEERRVVLREISWGDRVGAGRALAAARDPSLVTDLLRLLDDASLPGTAHQSVLQALGTMPAGKAGDVVRALEARIRGDIGSDLFVLQAISNRGGGEAARVLVAYLEQMEDPQRIPPFAFRGLDLASDEAAFQVVRDALRPDQSPSVLVALMRLAGRPGALGLVAPLLDLDGPHQPDEVRWEALQALARVGGKAAVRRLLDATGEGEQRAQVALRSLGSLDSASAETRAALVAALEDARRTTGAVAVEVSLIHALGAVRHGPAEELLAGALASREPEVRLAAVQALGRLGPVAAARVGPLVDLYAEGDESTRRTVVVALAGIGGDEARRALEQMDTDTTLSPSLKRTVSLSLLRLREGRAPEGDGGGAVLGGAGSRPER